MVQRTSEKASQLPAPMGTVRQDFVLPIGNPGVASYQLTLGRISPRFNVLNYATSQQNATDISTGQADPSAAFLAADAAAAAVGGTVYVPNGTYGTGANWTYALSSGVTLEGDGDTSVLRNCYVSCFGIAGNEIAFTAPAAKGATSISIPATGLTGAWLRISSCINMQSTNAGRDQLGHDAAAMGFFSEYVQVLSGGASSATLSGALVWAYSNTPGGDSGSFTTSAARVVTFHESARIRKIKLLGKNSAQNHSIEARFARDLIIEDVTADCDDITNQIIRLRYCLDCHVVDGKYIGKRTSVPAGSTANPIVLLSSQACTVNGASIYYGNQGVDIDCMSNDTTYRGGPSINCGIVDCQAFSCATDGFTSHWGCYGSFIDNPRVTGSPRGVRIRDRGASVRGGKLVNGAGTGIGVLVDNAATCDSSVAEVEIVGYLEGIQYDHSATGYATLEALLGGSLASARNNKIRDCADHGIYLNTAYTSATMVGPRLENNSIQNCTDDSIQVNSYWNGTIIDKNRITGVPATVGGIRWNANIKRLYVGENHIYGVNATGLALIGAGTASFMTDTTTFPLGEAEAFLYIGRIFTDAASGFVFGSIIRNVSAYALGQVQGYGPCVSQLGTSSATAERQTFGVYLSGGMLRSDARDTSNNFSTHIQVLTGTADPTAGAGVVATMPALYIRTSTGVLYTKTNTGDTNWTVVGTQT